MHIKEPLLLIGIYIYFNLDCFVDAHKRTLAANRNFYFFNLDCFVDAFKRTLAVNRNIFFKFLIVLLMHIKEPLLLIRIYF